MSRDPHAFTRSLQADARQKIETRLVELDNSAAKAEEVLRAIRVEERSLRQALAKLEIAIGESPKDKILLELADGPLTKDEILSRVAPNGTQTREQRSLTALVRHGVLHREGDTFSLAEEAA